MMRQYELVERVQQYKPDANEALLNKAYVYAMQKHGQQKRASGDPYISHPLEVAAILTDMHLDESTIAVALLHDTIEDTTATRAEIDELFGEDIGRLVEGLTKIKKLDLVTKKAKQAENLRKLLLAISDDVRVLLVKLADRLHNMRTLDHMSADKRARISEETMEIYAPLAGRMGMQDMREELEELSFRHMNPEAYETVTKRLEELSKRNEGIVKKIEAELRDLLVASGLTSAYVKGRQKKPYSVFRKMQSKSLSFEQLSDVYGFRLIVEDIPSCYRALGIVHTRWRVVPGRFKDYISTPKQNDYRSLHTTIVGPSSQRIELQIRTKRMHEIAEFGIAAHTLYKDGATNADGDILSRESNAYSWLRHTIEALAEGDSPEEFLEHTKLELFQDQVFCFTPKGKLIALPRGATPIDFAYAVHTNIGDTTVGAKINGRIMPLVTRLANGDEVEIIRSGVQVPPAAWEEIVVTGKARAAIRRATRMAIRKQYAGLGHRILERTFNRAGKIFSREAMKPALHRLGQKDVEDAIAAVGRGEMSSLDVLRAVYPDHQDERVTVKPSGDDGWFNVRSAAGMIFKIPGKTKAGHDGGHSEIDTDADIGPIRGLSGNVDVKFAPTGAVPGDRIVGIMDQGKGITIYPIQSPSLQRFDDQPDRWIDVRWDLDEANKSRFMARIMVNGLNEPGTLAKVAQTVAGLDVNIRLLNTVRVAADFTEMMLEVEVWDLRQLNQLLAQMKELDCIATVRRLYE
ncbi:bifunctional (p)ppGpp synthetase/guanosine-3',5'-bis(diphosphate) 3'-pyrophosphohydrolase [Rhizobium brockwellii]|jgi:guanosine-3',5'-bis(diphosphate) 3'-pyrophosphohydrolase|uniref:GTP pyrophosphokinase rsh n=2 Tax=Rhizobium TaxID=379 RepID=A0ABU3YJU4_9HYPH|nr:MULTISPECIES: bifunctional (p)ppGpp synthetase/guanosine-3',5'-bis(diphosphate) 3'-pyrophosphohydrolase [Rhizobium]MDV4179128.1 bifunctional (p)ppGpp synthetase/guanosine-3',5'-bis(diphosphate) 3'-pyrophosphohydrolase [Rhizobium brockwellii]MDV4186126.1 bifunctional (p)ppGpp synthetase/guanosine-3',5'-bis(diphosphate) 3'-pyrophosphohydrolase [Rhizobium brockwellii]QIO52535.1 bifunctional (p)ppGpp synthetase/guanosine-3',5'-bis(diphosphate) 3'-pyrophosphohydrolase [Rhizobium leguminosarum bv. 